MKSLYGIPGRMKNGEAEKEKPRRGGVVGEGAWRMLDALVFAKEP